jgi:hypothetical protein
MGRDRIHLSLRFLPWHGRLVVLVDKKYGSAFAG